MVVKLLSVLNEPFKKVVPYICPAFPISVSYFLHDEFKIFFMFVVLIPIFTIYRFDGRILVAYGISLLILVAVLTVMNEGNFADQLVIFSYWLLVGGTSCLAIDFFRKND